MAKEQIDFGAIKAAVSFQRAIDYLGLDMLRHGEQFRGPCPTCDTDNPRALVITPSKGFNCFGDKRGGDVVGLVAHCKGIGQRDAAEMMQNDLMGNSSPRNRSLSGSAGNRTDSRGKRTQEERQGPASKGLEPLDYLEPDHEAVEALGLTAVDAEALGIGYAPRGTLRGYVAVPIRLADGTLVGYIGIEDAKLPTRWHGINVVPFPNKKRA